MKNDDIIMELVNSGEVIVDTETGTIHASVTESVQSQGYKRLQYKNKYTLFSHRVVAYVVFGIKFVDYEVNHIDGNKLNNHPNNLELVTHKENMQHAVFILRKRSKPKKLTESQVLEIRSLYNTGKYTQTELSNKFGVSTTQIFYIVNNILWKHI